MATGDDSRTRQDGTVPRGDNTRSGEPTFPVGGGATLARFDRPRGSGTTLAVVADPHLTPTRHGTLKLYHRTVQRFRMAVADAHRLDVDGFVVAGDLTTDGTEAEAALAGELLGTAPEPAVAAPGNHDLTSAAEGEAAAFGRRYAGEPYPVTRRIGGATVTLLDSTHPDGHLQVGGGLADDALASLAADEVTTPRTAVLHHPVSPLPEPIEGAFPAQQFRLRDPAATADMLRAAGVELVVTGHVHWPYATTYRGLRVVGAPSSSSFPPAYLLLHLDARGTTVSIVPLADEDGLTEAYEFAVADERRGSAIQAAVADGYFEAFPMVDERTVASTGAGAAPYSSTVER